VIDLLCSWLGWRKEEEEEESCGGRDWLVRCRSRNRSVHRRILGAVIIGADRVAGRKALRVAGWIDRMDDGLVHAGGISRAEVGWLVGCVGRLVLQA
jgi:hypothetical protein